MSFLLSITIWLIGFNPIQSDTSTVNSSIEDVTVFRNQAQVERIAKVDLKSGKNTIVFTNLSATMIPQSIQLKGNGAFTLLSILNRTNFTETKTSNSDLQKLIDRRDSLQKEFTSIKARIKVIDSNIALLNSSSNITNNHKLSAAELDALLDLQGKRLLDFEERKIVLNTKSRNLDKEIQLLNNQIRESGATIRNHFKEVVAEVEVSSASTIEFSLQYLVHNAGWNPSYDVRANSISSPLYIDFKANIYQNTGYDWKDVNFTINSGDPSQSLQKPELFPSFVGFFQSRSMLNTGKNSRIETRRTSKKGVIEGRVVDKSTNEILIGASVFFPGLNLGSSVNNNGSFTINNVPNGTHVFRVNFIGYKSYSGYLTVGNSGMYVSVFLALDISGLEEVVVTGYSSENFQGKLSGVSVNDEANYDTPVAISNQEISNQTSFSYKINRPYTVPSDGKEYTLAIKKEQPNTKYIYSTVPKLSANAYLIGKLTEWDDLNLIEGDANIYFESSFVGSTYLDPSSLSDTLEMSLGKDERIIVERKKLKDFEERRFFGSKTRESLSFEISIRNTKKESVEILVEDQIPISRDESIKVSPKELSGGKLNKETGIIEWKIDLAPNETKKLRLDFQIEYPKGKRISY